MQSPLSQFESIHTPRQIDIGEDKVDHEFRLQSLDRFLRRGRLMNAIPALAQELRHVHSD